MKQLLLSLLLLTGTCAHAQTKEKRIIYHPEANAAAELDAAIKKAGAEGKHVLIQAGGNWCGWCILFHDLVDANDTLKNYLNQNYEVVLLNYSAENKNEEVFARLDYPQRFGFPVFIILDGKGKRIHTQNSAYLEEGKGHNSKKVLAFFKDWSTAAVNPSTYPKK